MNFIRDLCFVVSSYCNFVNKVLHPQLYKYEYFVMFIDVTKKICCKNIIIVKVKRYNLIEKINIFIFITLRFIFNPINRRKLLLQ